MVDFFSPEEIEAMEQTVVRCALLVKFDFLSETVRVWNGERDLVAGGQTWTPLYGTGQVNNIEFSGEAVSDRFDLSIHAVPGVEPDIFAKALAETEEAEGRVVTVYFLLMDEEWQSYGAPVGVKWGYMRKPRVTWTNHDEESGGVRRISIGAENIWYNRSLPPAGRYTDADQQARSPGDLICQFVPSLRNKNFTYPDY
ncbi:hypothetical protein K1W69_17535 [Hoeflea sp. WL0058]|uniref:Uncharacterized protein n=1 Tax=Flavimaribacter sediminis TaxID=2865987 RepID=A0AAE2ZLZ4_9HYPH|nr:hypothetical protein [Flavimaribacter sediminis]MBW8639003.1 hypothetical protein [Flavimaribacter sediminis]